MGQRWLIRVASHRRHGGGHVARCAVLASALVDVGADVVVQLDADSPEAAGILAPRGLSCSEDTPTGPIDGIVLDGYELMEKEAAALARRAPLVAIDDFLDPPHVAALVVNCALHLEGDHVGTTPALLGPRFALVDPRFSALPTRDHTGPVRHVLVTMGRIDAANLTSSALDALATADTTVTVVASRTSPAYEAVRRKVDGRGGAVRLETDVTDMAPLLAEADFVIGAGGVSLVERVAAGMPSLTLLLADNQSLFIEGAARLGVTIDGSDMNTNDIAVALEAAFADGNARDEMARAGRRTIDGRGPARVAERLVAMAGARPDKRQAAV